MNKNLLVNRDCFIDFFRKADFREILRTPRVFNSGDRWIVTPPRDCDATLTRPFETFGTVKF